MPPWPIQSDLSEYWYYQGATPTKMTGPRQRLRIRYSKQKRAYPANIKSTRLHERENRSIFAQTQNLLTPVNNDKKLKKNDFC